MHPFAQLEKNANVGQLLRKGVGSLWRSGTWPTLARMTQKGIQQGGRIGAISKFADPVARALSGKVGMGLGAYGMASMVFPKLPGAQLAMNIGTPVLGAVTTAHNAIKGRRANSAEGRAAIEKDVEAGSSRAMQDFISGLHVDPNVANNVDAYRSFSEQIGRGMQGADTYAAGGYSPLSGMDKIRTGLSNPNAVIQNSIRNTVQQRLPGIMKQAGFMSTTGKVLGHGLSAMGALTLAGAGVGLGSTLLNKNKPTHDSQMAQDEGYAAAQAAIQDRLKNMSGLDRMLTKWDPTIAANALASKHPGALKQWEAQYGPLKRGLVSSTLNSFQNPSDTRFYSTDAAGNQNFIN